MSKRHAATIAARAGIAQDTAFGAVTPPLYLTSTYELTAFKQAGQYDYSRSNNPTRDVLAEAQAIFPETVVARDFDSFQIKRN